MPISTELSKYNKEWNFREPIVYRIGSELRNSQREVTNLNIGNAAKSALLMKKLFNCNGLEFVMFANVKISSQLNLSNGIIINPCFLPTTFEQSIDDPLVRAKFTMEENSRFIYDCWLPIHNWNENEIDREVRKIDETLSLFSLNRNVTILWEPKYFADRGAKFNTEMNVDELKDIELLLEKTNELKEIDRVTFFRSLAWLKRAETIDDFIAKFLFCMLSIESMANYIENEAEDDSFFVNFRSEKRPKKEKNQERLEIIKECLIEFEDNPFDSISKAYFNGVISIKSSTQKHLIMVFKDSSDFVDKIFKPKGDSLYDIRSKIAHGKTNIIDDIERKEILYRSYEIEKIARQYLWKLLCLEINNISTIASSTSNYLDIIIQRREQYDEPTHMALIY